MLAAEYGKHETVKVLLDFESTKKNLKNLYEYTALILAAEKGHDKCVDMIINDIILNDDIDENNVDENYERGLDIANKFGKTALIMAAENGKLKVVESLLTAKADVNKVSKRGLSALMLAAVQGHTEVVMCLTAHGADISIQNKDKVRIIFLELLNNMHFPLKFNTDNALKIYLY